VFPGYGACVPADVERVVKSQRVRVADVLLIGPIMAWGGAKLAPRYPVAGGLLALLGVATVLYNGRNYLTVRDALNTGA
jgi:hypothetical protein